MTSKKAPAASPPTPTRGFKSQKDFAAWLEKNHRSSDGFLLRIARKGAGVKSITYPEAVETALCYGWIDGQKLPESETAWLQRFTPRRKRSPWSKINREKALALIANGQMQRAGLDEVERARTDGRWESAYDPQSAATIPPELAKELDRHPKAKAFFQTLRRANSYAIIWRIQTAKRPETREKRIRTYIEMLEKGETLH
jgi:uncharacterized protein YdeI (YjbR/CyaY-like superfamily)